MVIKRGERGKEKEGSSRGYIGGAIVGICDYRV
jgi:hypothetical protein